MDQTLGSLERFYERLKILGLWASYVPWSLGPCPPGDQLMRAKTLYYTSMIITFAHKHGKDRGWHRFSYHKKEIWRLVFLRSRKKMR